MREQNAQLQDQPIGKRLPTQFNEKPLPFSRRSTIIQNEWRWFSICLLAPAGGALLRKFLPGQPIFAEVAAVIPILMAVIWVSRHGRTLPQWVSRPLIYWGLFQIAFAVPSVLEDWRVGISVLFTRIAPMFMAIVAYGTIRTWSDFRNASKWVVWLAILLFPIGLIVVFFGNSILPTFLQPIDKILIIERDIRNGFPSAATIFTTQWILSWSALSILYLALSNLLLPAFPTLTKNQRYLFLIASLASLFLIYASFRRGALVAGLIGFIAFFLFLRNRFSLQILVVTVIFLIGLSLIIDNYGYNVGNKLNERSGTTLILMELDPSKRIEDTFLPYFVFWLDATPLGNYVGYAGPEARGLGNLAHRMYNDVIEVGGAQLVAEMGILGAIIMPLILIIISVNILVRSQKMLCASSVRMLLVFQAVIFLNYYFKEMLALVNPSMGLFFFWAIPGLCVSLMDYESTTKYLKIK